MISNAELKARSFGRGMINPRDQFSKKMIEDIPVMFTTSGKLLCIPKTDEVKHIGICGATGSCKSLFVNAQLSWHYWMLKRACIIFNDFQKETQEWSLPTNTISFIKVFKKINAKPCPSPIVYIYPSTKTLQIDKKDERFPLLKMGLPTEEIINHIENYWKLDKSKVYLGNIKEELKECNSITEIEAVLDESFPEQNQKGMLFKMKSIFQDLFENEMLEVTVPEAPAFLEYHISSEEVYRNYTIQTILRAGLIPSIQTFDLRTQEYFSAYMSFIVNSIYQNQYDDSYFKKITISLFVDEIDKLWSGHEGKLIKQSLGLVGTNGRAARIGMVWATQSYGKVNDSIRDNTKYLFVSRMKDAKEVNEIKKDFQIPKIMEKDILKLKKDPMKGVFEILALTTEQFILYDLVNGNKTKSSEAHMGYLIPPIARHHVPNQPI